ncbi:MAG: hypothetical protein ACOY4R_10725 [Pseudomonadota bacterium]
MHHLMLIGLTILVVACGAAASVGLTTTLQEWGITALHPRSGDGAGRTAYLPPAL